jgi:hypothetical protein
MRMKDCLIVAAVLLVAAVSGMERLGDVQAQSPTMSKAQLAAVTTMDMKACSEKVPVVPQGNVQAFPQDRIERTLHGIWRGRVSGEYEKQFLAKDGFLNVDYYMVVDTKRKEALVFEQLGPKRAVRAPKAGAASWSFLMCGRERYLPHHPAQVHEFQKVSDNVEDARTLLGTSTGLTFTDKSDVVLSSAWQRLVSTKYFDNLRAPAYAGGLFKPFEMKTVTEDGKSMFSMRYEAEYRGGGATAAKFQSGVPIRGAESGQFVGVTTATGDFLVSSLGNGSEFKKEAQDGGLINMFFDKVVIGPLAGADAAAPRPGAPE